MKLNETINYLIKALQTDGHMCSRVYKNKTLDEENEQNVDQLKS